MYVLLEEMCVRLKKIPFNVKIHFCDITDQNKHKLLYHILTHFKARLYITELSMTFITKMAYNTHKAY